MNTETQQSLSSISPGTAFRNAALAALLTLASAAAFADPPTAPAADTRVAKVSLAGLDLSTPEGTQAAYARIMTVAERLCFHLGDPSLIDNQAIYKACVAETLADSMRRIKAPALAAIEK
jgi:UrcA family protein